MKQGDHVSHHYNGMFCEKWLDSKSIFMLSTIDSCYEKTTVKKRVKGSIEKVQASCPVMIHAIIEEC